MTNLASGREMPMWLQRQRGAAMVIALIMLLVLTVIGTATARMTLLEERMTGNTGKQIILFNIIHRFMQQVDFPFFNKIITNAAMNIGSQGAKIYGRINICPNVVLGNFCLGNPLNFVVVTPFEPKVASSGETGCGLAGRMLMTSSCESVNAPSDACTVTL